MMSAYLRALASLESWSLGGDGLEPEILEAYREAAKCLASMRAKRIRVLDVGAGGGGDLRYIRRSLDEAQLSLRSVEVVAVEPNRCTWSCVEREQKRWLPQIAGFQLLPSMPESSPEGFDMAVLQHVLCCAERPENLLCDVQKALRPGGQLVFVEHVLADSSQMPYLRTAQAALRSVQMAVCNGCDPCRDTERLFEGQLFEEVKLKRFNLPVLGVQIPHIKGVAVKRESDPPVALRGPLTPATLREFL
ncbi:METTL7A [Symbiodinium natans]|uniref:METTL7A protein n=1 Tax=Symbiodinium natans TaxID=878477 RepID=A0A812HYV8_9DINO|nr:METTL7A [Symbiodinium natans]